MKILRGWITPTVLTIVIMFSIVPVKAGIVVGNRGAHEDKSPCQLPTAEVDWAVIVGNLTAVIVGNFVGIIVKDGTAGTDCAVIVGN